LYTHFTASIGGRWSTHESIPKPHKQKLRKGAQPGFSNVGVLLRSCLLTGIWHYSSMAKKKPKKKSAKKHTKRKPAPKRGLNQIAARIADKVTKGQILL
jgi:hypothetical protein